MSEAPRDLPVLVVDDNGEMVSIVENVLGFYGHRAVGLNRGEQALDYLRDNVGEYLCFFDVTLPGVSGLELLRYMESVAHPARVVLMSGEGTDLPEECAALLGFLHKPFGFEDLKTLLEHYALLIAEH